MPLYLITYTLVFWFPAITLGLLLLRKMDSLSRKAFWITMAIMTSLTTVMEYVYLSLGIWTFSEKVDPLLGIWIWGAPIEEFVFWWGASPFIILVYLGFANLYDRRTKTHA